jgi:MFS family permease
MAMAMYGMAVVVAPILGPVLGGQISDNYCWRWIFYINVLVGIISLVLTSLVVRDPPGMAEHVTPLNLAVGRWTGYFAQARMIRGGVSQAVANDQAMGLLTQMVREQARVMAYLDAF